MARLIAVLCPLALMGAALSPPALAGDDPDARAARVEAQLNDDERLGLLHGIMAMTGQKLPTLPDGVQPSAGYLAGVARLGVPALRETDGAWGVTNPLEGRPGDTATAFPSGQAMASSWNPELVRGVGGAIAREARSKGFNVLLGGGMNLARNPRNGRNFEYLGEDPLLAGTLAGDYVAGAQAEHVVATIKHFAFNNDETLRRDIDVRIGEQAAHESDLLAFEIAIERGRPGSVMCSYNRVNGAKACGNDWLLNRVLKHDWGYKGWVMSDWGAVDAVGDFAAGLDQQSGQQLDRQVWFDAPLRAEIAAGRISHARVSDAVRRVLRSLYAVGADRLQSPGPISTAADAKLALEAARQGLVLLKNEDGILPLAQGVRSILVVGGHADRGVLSGGGSSQVTPANGKPLVLPYGGTGEMGQYVAQVFMPSSPLAELKRLLPDVKIDYDGGYVPAEAAARAAKADIVVVFATSWQMEAHDNADMTLPEGQDALLSAVLAANPRNMVVIESGNPVAMPWADKAGAILAAWYPGQEGGRAVAEVLTGAVNPSGHLPQSWPIGATQNPRPAVAGFGQPRGTRVQLDYAEGADVGYRWFAREHLAPRFAFGHGLSYTTFAVSGLVASATANPQASVTVRNTGNRAGATVIQVYLTEAAGQQRMRLAGFARVELAAGEQRRVTLTLDRRLLADWSAEGWRISRGRYTLAAGQSADRLEQYASITLPGSTFRTRMR